MPINADGAKKNKILIGKKQAKPLYTFNNKQLAIGSVKGTFNSNIISNELPIDTFSFSVKYDDEASAVYITSDTNQAYVCAGYIEGTFEQTEFYYTATGGYGRVEGNECSFTQQSGNNVIRIAPKGRSYFYAGDVIQLKVSADVVASPDPGWSYGYCNFTYPTWVGEIKSQTGLFSVNVVSDYLGARTFSSGDDVLTFKVASDANYVRINLTATVGTVITIKGLSYNGKVYYDVASEIPPALYVLSDNGKTPAKDYLRDIKYGTPVFWYCDNKFMMKGYYKGNTRTSRTTWQIDAMSAIGKLDEKMHVGGIYTGATFEEVLTEICGNTCRFEFDEGDEALANLQVFGWLPYDTARNNLHRLLFAMGASIKRKAAT